MTQFYAQPYDITANGFYFESVEDYDTKASALRNDYGDAVEEFEIQFIDGEAIDCELAKAIGINQANLAQFFDCVEKWDEDEKRIVVIALGDCGYPFDPDMVPADYDIDIYPVESLNELAEQFVEEGLFGDIPKALENYIDMDAIARDLGFDYSEAEIAGQRLIYRQS
jgi:antirestriction protein